MTKSFFKTGTKVLSILVILSLFMGCTEGLTDLVGGFKVPDSSWTGSYTDNTADTTSRAIIPTKSPLATATPAGTYILTLAAEGPKCSYYVKIDNVSNYLLPDTVKVEGGTHIIEATAPKCGYEFAYWSDKIKENPRKITVSSNISLTAVFRAISPTATPNPTKTIGLRTPTPTKTIGLRTPTPTKTIGFRTPTPTKTIGFRTPTPTKTIGFRTPTPTKTIGFRTPTPTKTIGLRTPTPTKTIGFRTPTPTKTIEEQTPTPTKTIEEQTPTPTKTIEEQTPTPTKTIEEQTPTPTATTVIDETPFEVKPILHRGKIVKFILFTDNTLEGTWESDNLSLTIPFKGKYSLTEDKAFNFIAGGTATFNYAESADDKYSGFRMEGEGILDKEITHEGSGTFNIKYDNSNWNAPDVNGTWEVIEQP